MDWIDRLTGAVAYIEENLRDEVDWQEAARRACCSAHHFARMFALLTDTPLSEYVRRRRLALAAQELRDGAKVLDVALAFGYASPTAFHRAFMQFHGCPPSHARRPGVALQAYLPISFHLSIRGGVALTYRMEENAGFRIVGFGEKVSLLNGENLVRIPKMWCEMTAERNALLDEHADKKWPGMLGVCAMCAEPNLMTYTIAVSSGRQEIADGLTAMDIPPATYAVFETPFNDIQGITRRIYGEWLPASGYEHAGTPDFEFYPDGDMSDESKYICEIWVPVVKG